MTLIINCRPLKPFTKCNNEILWQREFEQMLYRVTEQELIPARYIDFQEFAYNGKLEKNTSRYILSTTGYSTHESLLRK